MRATDGTSTWRDRARLVLGRFDSLLEPSTARPVAWRSLAGLFIGAGVLILTTVLFGVDEPASVPLIAALGATATVCGLVAFPLASRLPERWVLPGLWLGLALISLAIVATGEPDSPYGVLYVWVGVEAWFFLRSRQAVALTAATIVVSAAVLLQASSLDRADHDAAAWWVMLTGTLLVVSMLAGVLHGRARRLIARLEYAVERDPLTGLFNRRGYQHRLDTELARARRYGQPLAIVLGDLDAFKALNDRFGHREGDQALRAFAGLCSEHLREVDFVARVGGEEFAVVLPDTDEKGAVLVAERLRHAVSDRLRTPRGESVTASFGVAAYPKHGEDAEVLLDHADQAMYAAKALGRDRTQVFAGDLPRADDPTDRREHLRPVLLLAETLDLRDETTHRHSETVAGLAESIARALGLEEGHIERLRLAGLLHDIGKIGISDAVLRKPDRLDATEWAEMRKHPEIGARIVEGAGIKDIARWVLLHHERPDGAGYPYGLEGDAVPLEARILAVADAYEAMTADRPYRRAMDEAAATAELERGAGTQFDADVVRAFRAAHALRARVARPAA